MGKFWWHKQELGTNIPEPSTRYKSYAEVSSTFGTKICPTQGPLSQSFTYQTEHEYEALLNRAGRIFQNKRLYSSYGKDL